MTTLEQALTEPFTETLGALEPLRKLMLSVAHSDASLAPGNIVQRTMFSDLRALFPPPPVGAPPPEPPEDGSSTLEFARALDAAAPKVGKLQTVLAAGRVPLEEQALIRRYTEHWLPQRRVEGYCALLCACAGRR